MLLIDNLFIKNVCLSLSTSLCSGSCGSFHVWKRGHQGVELSLAGLLLGQAPALGWLLGAQEAADKRL